MQIDVFDLSHNTYFRDACLIKLIQLLRLNPSPQCLKQNVPLLDLNLEKSSLSDKSMLPFLEVLPGLEKLNIGHNTLPRPFSPALTKYCKQTKNCV